MGHPTLKNEKLQITTSYEYGNDEYTEENSVWESTDPTVATVVKGLVTPLKAGAATITLKVGAKPYVALTVTVAANEWIEIGTPEQFNSIHNEGTDGSPLNGNYVLTADLDFAGKEALFSSWEKNLDALLRECLTETVMRLKTRKLHKQAEITFLIRAYSDM